MTPDVRPYGTPPLPDYTETRAQVEQLAAFLENPDSRVGLADRGMAAHLLRSLVAVLEAVTAERDEALKLAEDSWKAAWAKAQRDWYSAVVEKLPAAEAERDALAAQVATRDEALRTLEETFASPHRECSQEDIDPDGMRVGNACIDAEPGDLLFPDDYCERCYVLVTVRAARRSAALPDGPVQPQETER